MAPWWLRGNEDEAHPEVDSLDDGPEEASEDENGPESGKHPAADDDEDDDEDENHEDDDEDDDEEEDEGESEGDEGEERPPRTRRRRRRRRKKPTRQDSDSAGSRPMTSRRVTQELPRPIASALFSPPGSATANDERRIAMLCDLENIALGVRDSEIKKLEIHLILERLLEKGKIIVKKAYADWERYSNYKRPCHEAAIELIDIPQKYYSGKNSADIKMVVDAMDLCYSKEHLDTFVLLSGDSDFTPLVSKLKENNKHVIGVGVKSSSSKLLIDNCDEFLYYEDIWRDSLQAPVLEGIDEKKAEAYALMNDSIAALIRENKPVLWGSMVKQTMQRKRPSFNEGYYGYGSFSDLLEDAERKKVINLKKDARSGSYVVTGFARAR